ncbi:MAG: MFS transporter [Leucobacter sp.]|nr:MFS transporter [Leucobacter sp.]
MANTQDKAVRSHIHTAVLVATLGASVLSSLDLFIVNLALPRIGEAFPAASPAAVSWVLNAYTVMFAALLAPAGRIADRYGRRRMFIIGLTFFAAGAIVTSLAPGVGWLIAGRALQGVGASVIVPTSLALLLEASQEREHKRMISIWTASGSVAAALGPVLGGLLADVDWRLVFAFKIPLAVGALFAARALPRSPSLDTRMPDLVGAACLAGTVAAFVAMLTLWGDGKSSGAWVWSFGALALAGFACVVFRSRRHPVPVVDLRLFRTPAFTFSVVGMTVFYIGFSMMLLACSLWATNVWEWDSVLVGLCFVLGPGMAVVTALAAGRTKLSAEWLSAGGGLLFVAAGIIWALTVTKDASPIGFIVGFLLTGAAAGIAQTGFLSGGAGALAPADYASGAGIINTGRQIGAAVGVALLVLYAGSGYDAPSYAVVWLTIAITGAAAALATLPVFLTARPPVS